MTENDPLHSGSRWEPQQGSTDRGSIPLPDDPAVAASATAFLTTDRPPQRGRRRLSAGAGAGILLLGGVGGFALGHAVAATGTGGTGNPSVVRNGIPGQNGVPGEGFGGGRSGPHDGVGDGDHGDVDGSPPGDGAASGGNA